MENICVTCLATDRSLQTLDSRCFVILKHLIMVQNGYEEIRIGNKVCWECKAQLNNVRKFQNKALESSQRLQELYQKSEIHNNYKYNSLTTLCLKKIENVNIHNDLYDCYKESYMDTDDFDGEGMLLVEKVNHDHLYASNTTVKIENDLGISVWTDPFDEETESAPSPDEYDIESYKKDSILNQNEDSVHAVQLQKTPQIWVKSFAIINEHDECSTSGVKSNTRKVRFNIKNESPTLNDESPDKSSMNNDKSTMNNDKSPINHDKSPINHDKSPINHDKSPINHDKSPINDDKSPINNDKSNSANTIMINSGNSNGTEARWNAMLQPVEPIHGVLTTEELHFYRERELKKPLYLRKTYKCESCIISFWCHLDFEKHNKNVHDESIGKYVCGICRRRYDKEVNYTNCQERHYLVYKCPKCDDIKWKYRRMQYHIYTKHPYTDFTCKICGKTFDKFRDASNHKRTHAKLIQCGICKKQLRSGEYNTHMAMKHPVNDPVKCSKCHKAFKSLQNLRTHMAMVHKEKEFVFCKHCNIFVMSYSYKSHLRSATHLGPHMKKFECDHCHKKFYRYIDICRHIRAIHLQIYDHKCSKCDKKYTTKNGLNRHYSKAHDPNYSQQSRCICDVCGLRFTGLRILKDHYVKHTGEKPYQCKKCPFKTGYSAALYTHNKLVHEKLKRKSDENPKRKSKAQIQNENPQKTDPVPRKRLRRTDTSEVTSTNT